MSDTTTDFCTFKLNGVVCGRLESDKGVHVAEDERMRRGAHLWRHEGERDYGFIVRSDAASIFLSSGEAERAVAEWLHDGCDPGVHDDYDRNDPQEPHRQAARGLLHDLVLAYDGYASRRRPYVQTMASRL